MKKLLLSTFLALSFGLTAQTYCTPIFGDGCVDGDMIDDFTIPSASFSDLNTGCSTGFYDDQTSQTITLTPTVSYPFSITHGYENQQIRIWIDFDNDGVFDPDASPSELVASAASGTSSDITNGNIVIPGAVAPGTYRMRVADRYGSTAPVPCDNGSSSYGEVHDYTVVVTAPPSCLSPDNVTIDNITTDSALLGWLTSGTLPSIGYEYYLSTSNTPPNASAVATGTIASTAVDHSLSSLTPNTQYYVWMRSDCGTEKSAWTSVVSFRTLCAPTTSLYENFDSLTTYTYTLPSCWDKLLGGSQYSQDVYSGGVTGNHIYLYSGSSTDFSVIILPSFSNVDAGTHQIRFRARVSSGTGSLEVGYITDATDESTFVSLETVAINNTSYATSNSEYIVLIPNTVPAGARIAIRNNGVSTSSHYIDDVHWEPIPSCSAPTDIVINNITTTEADVSWTAPSSFPSTGTYEIYYSTANTPPSATDAPQLTGITSISTTIDNLTASTIYYIWIRSNCGGGDFSSWSLISTFTTQCDAVASMYENFDSYATGSIVPTCWDRIVTGFASQTITSATPTASGNRQMYQYSSGASNVSYVVLPPFSNINAGTHQLRFFARSGSGSATLDVGYITDITDVSTFVSLETITFTNTTYDSNSEHSIIVPNTVPSGARLAIMNPGVSTSSHYWDDVYWEPIPTCGTPTDVAVDNITSNSADVSWVAPISSTPTEYEIYYSTSSTQPDINTVANVTGVTNTIYTITPLTPATYYYVWIRSVCSSTEKSNWTLMSTFMTSCVPVSAPYSNDFTVFPGACWSYASGGDPSTGSTDTVQDWYNDGFLNNGTTGAAYVNIWSSDFITIDVRAWLITPEIDLGASGADKIVKFNYGVTNYSSTGESDMGSDDVVNLLISTDSGVSWIILHTWDAANAPTNTSNAFVLPLTGYSGIVKFAFYGSNGTVADEEDYQFFVDDFEVTSDQLSTSEVVKKNTVQIYPNPFTEVLNISEIDKVKMVVISDATGRVVKTINKPEAQLHLADLTPGMYLVTLRMKDGTVQTVKTIKK